MSKLSLDCIRSEMQNFMEHGSCHCPEAVAGDLGLIKSHATQRSIDSILTHTAKRRAVAWENVPAMSGQ